MKIHLFKRLAKYYLNFLFSFLISSYSFAQERWFQIELSIFSNENIEDKKADIEYVMTNLFANYNSLGVDMHLKCRFTFHKNGFDFPTTEQFMSPWEFILFGRELSKKSTFKVGVEASLSVVIGTHGTWAIDM